MFYNKSGTKILVSICFVVCIATCISCKKRSLPLYPDAKIFSRDDFQEKISLKGKVLHLDSLWQANQIYIHDSILLVVTNRNTQSALRLFNVKDGQKTGEYIHIGRGPDELITCSQFQIAGEWIWAIDMTQNKYLKYRKKESLSKSFEESVANIILKNISVIQNPVMIDSNKIIGNTRINNRLLTFYDLDKQEIDTDIDIPYPTNIDVADFVKQRTFEYRLATDMNHIYMAYCFTDLIDIYDKNGILIRRVFGPDHFLSVYKEMNFGNAYTAVPTKDTKFAYQSPVITNDGLMVLWYYTMALSPKAGTIFLIKYSFSVRPESHL